ncbi:tyrosine-type recombinase/integrase [Geodermatophilus sp. CPCC 206100]
MGEPPSWRPGQRARSCTPLRHSYAAGLIAFGCDVVTVQRPLGHASTTTTLNTYSHLWPTAEDRTRRAAEQLFADSCGLCADSDAPTSR